MTDIERRIQLATTVAGREQVENIRLHTSRLHNEIGQLYVATMLGLHANMLAAERSGDVADGLERRLAVVAAGERALEHFELAALYRREVEG